MPMIITNPIHEAANDLRYGAFGSGGHVRQPDRVPSLFISSTPPVIHDNTIIVAVTHPNVQTGAQTRDGWFLSDFYAFNYLLKGLGSRKTWLTAAVSLC